MKRILLISSLMVLMIVGCGKIGKNSSITIAYDPSWAELNLEDQQPWLTGYMTELFKYIAKEEKVTFTLIEQNQMLLMPGLKDKKYDGIVSIVMPTNFREAKMSFSTPFLETGSVLVIRENSIENYSSIKDLGNKQVGIIDNQTGIYVSEKAPKAYIIQYPSYSGALHDLEAKNIEGVVMDRIHALGFVNNLYQGKLKIAGSPITDEAIRVVALKEDPKEVISIFDRGWKKLQSQGKVEKLLKKWKLI